MPARIEPGVFACAINAYHERSMSLLGLAVRSQLAAQQSDFS